MILTCEQCKARYTVDDSRFGTAVRTVRCASCGHSWKQEPLAGMAAPSGQPAADLQGIADVTPVTEILTDPEQPVVRRFAAPRRPAKPLVDPRMQAIRLAAMLAAPTLVLLVVLWAMRGTLVAVWPSSARLYAAIGMVPAVAAPGLTVLSVHTQTKTEDGHRVLLVEGELSNTGDTMRPLPALHATITQGDTVKAHWTFDADATQLAPGEKVAFHTKLSDPPEGAGSVSVGPWQ